MAFESVRTNATKKATELKSGESLIGYVVRIEESRQYEGRYNLVMQDPESGEQYTLFGAGTMNYDIKDGRVRVGLLTRITAQGKKRNKRGQDVSQFDIAQDRTQALDAAVVAAVAADDAASASAQAGIKERTKALKDRVSGTANG